MSEGCVQGREVKKETLGRKLGLDRAPQEEGPQRAAQHLLGQRHPGRAHGEPVGEEEWTHRADEAAHCTSHAARACAEQACRELRE